MDTKTTSRRNLLRTCLASSTILLAGCNQAKKSDTTSYKLCEVTVANLDDSPHDISIQILKNGETAITKSKTLPKSDDPNDSVSVTNNLPINGREIRVKITLDKEKTNEINLSDYSLQSTELFVTITKRKTLKLYYSKGCK